MASGKKVCASVFFRDNDSYNADNWDSYSNDRAASRLTVRTGVESVEMNGGYISDPKAP